MTTLTIKPAKHFILSAVLIAVALSAATVSPALTNLLLVGLLAMTLLGSVWTIQAMALSVIVKYLNPALAVYTMQTGLLLWLILLVGGSRLLLSIRVNSLRLLTPVWIFSAIALTLSCFASPVVSVSVLKIFTFAWIVSGVIAGYQSFSDQQLEKMKIWFLSLALVVALGSGLLSLQPAIGNLLVSTSLQGILNHPQALGTFVSPFASWAAAAIALRRGRPTLMQLAFVGLLWTVMFMTLARTASIAAVAGVVVAAFVRFTAGRRDELQAATGKIVGVLVLGVLSVAAAAATTDVVTKSVSAFILKREAQSLDQAFYESRGWGIQSQWRNFLRKPFSGNGYGVYADGSFPDGVVKFAGIPISAPVEKGFIPTAVLEETGIFGGLAFLMILIRLSSQALRNLDLRWIAVFTAALLVNVGEAVILSPGGMGLHVWLMIGLAVVSARQNRPHAAGVVDSAHERGPVNLFLNLMTNSGELAARGIVTGKSKT